MIENLLRELAPVVVGNLVRRYGGFETCEDAVQEALLAASMQWPKEGVPENPAGWLIRVASRRWTDMQRNDAARLRREQAVAQLSPPSAEPPPDVDDTLTLFFLCCNPALTPVSQAALTLRAVGGLSNAEIARAFLVPGTTIAQRITRAKRAIRASGAEFTLPRREELPARTAAVLHVLYLIFNEGYTASSGAALYRVELTVEAIRLARQLQARLPDDGEVAGLLALMLLTDARRPARIDADGQLLPLDRQDRTLWNADAIAEGVELITATLPKAQLGPYQLQAAIAAVHDEAKRAEDTDWPQILILYDMLESLAPGPMVTLNRAVAVSMVHGPLTALAELACAEANPALAGHHRLHAIRAHLNEMAGDREAARAQFELAARSTLCLPEQRYLAAHAAQLASPDRSGG